MGRNCRWAARRPAVFIMVMTMARLGRLLGSDFGIGLGGWEVSTAGLCLGRCFSLRVPFRGPSTRLPSIALRG